MSVCVRKQRKKNAESHKESNYRIFFGRVVGFMTSWASILHRSSKNCSANSSLCAEKKIRMKR